MEEVALQIQRLWGGEFGGAALHTVVGDDGGQNGALPVALCGQPGVQHGFQVVGGGGLALGAGNAGNGELPGGVTVGQIRQQAHGGADVGDLNAGGGAPLGVGLLAHIGKGPPLQGLGQIGPLEGLPLAEKEGVRHHLLRVAGHQRHPAAQIRPEWGGVGQQMVLDKQLVVVA